jgi:hypothetical protein
MMLLYPSYLRNLSLKPTRVPHTPNFLLSLIEPANFMRLSL